MLQIDRDQKCNTSLHNVIFCSLNVTNRSRQHTIMVKLQNIFTVGNMKEIHAYVQSNTVKLVYNSHSQKDQKLVFKNNDCLMHVRSIAECSKGNVLQYFRPSLLILPFVIKIFVLSFF